MRESTIGILLSLVIGPFAGVAAAAPSAIVPALVPHPPTEQTPLGLVVAPVQIRTSTGIAADGTEVPMIFTNHSLSTVMENPEIPALPYGSFLVGIANSTDHEMTITPRQIELVADGDVLVPLSDEQHVTKRWLTDAYVDSIETLVGHLVVRDDAWTVHKQLNIMTGPVTIPAKGSWTGYIVFDTGTISAVEYSEFLSGIKELELRVSTGEVRSTAQFNVAPGDWRSGEDVAGRRHLPVRSRLWWKS